MYLLRSGSYYYVMCMCMCICVRNGPHHVIRTAENSSSTPEKLAVSLLQALFSEEELRHGDCSQPLREGILLLDQEMVRRIRGNCVHFAILEIIPF